MRNKFYLCLCLCLCLAGGTMLCSCLHSPRPTRIFILSLPEEPLNPSVGARISRVSLPAYLQRWELVSRMGEHEIRVHDFAQWGQLLAEAIRSCLQESFRLPPESDRQDKTIPVLEFSFQQFEGNKDGTFTVKGQCRLDRADMLQQLPFEFSFSYPPDDEETLIKAHQEALRRLTAIVQAQITQP